MYPARKNRGMQQALMLAYLLTSHGRDLTLG